MIVRVVNEAGNEMAVLRGMIPIQRTRYRNLLVEVARSHDRNRYFDAIVERRGDPGVVAPSGRAGHSDALRINLFTA